jgi:hypothetical protein
MWTMLTGAIALIAGMAAVEAGRPSGSTTEPTGFATILKAPPSPTGDVKPTPRFATFEEWYAHEHGLSVAEGKRRIAEQRKSYPDVQRLAVELTAKEAGNYAGARMIHRPDWGYVFSFRRDPERTLARYTSNPRFTAEAAPPPAPDPHVLAKPWTDRLGAAGVLGTLAVNPSEGTATLMVRMTESEYRTLAAREGWGTPPAGVRLNFITMPPVQAVDPRIAPLLRGFAYERLPTMLQPEAGYSGRIVLQDGCLRLERGGPLAVFHNETGIGLDAQGYLALIDRRTGKATGRIGEKLSWPGPNDGKDLVGLEELQEACGETRLFNVGNPESQARFKKRNPGY